MALITAGDGTQMKIGVTAPVYVSNEEHKKYLDLTTKSIVSTKHEIVWMPCENYVNPTFKPLYYVFDHVPSEMRVLQPDGKQSVSHAWNLGIEEGKKAGCDYILVINTDIIFKTNAIDRLVDFAEKHPEAVMWTGTQCEDLATLELCPENENITENPHYSCFMVKNDFFSNVGTFDENFAPSYCEDVDMYTRLLFAGKKAYKYGGTRFFHFGSQTIKSDEVLLKNNSRTHSRCQLYFLEKWGHPMIEDVEQIKRFYFKHPYNEVDKPLSYWRPPASAGFTDSLPLSIQYRLVSFLNWTKRTKGRVKHA
jgi:GT2 family glycosyltransferase